MSGYISNCLFNLSDSYTFPLRSPPAIIIALGYHSFKFVQSCSNFYNYYLFFFLFEVKWEHTKIMLPSAWTTVLRFTSIDRISYLLRYSASVFFSPNGFLFLKKSKFYRLRLLTLRVFWSYGVRLIKITYNCLLSLYGLTIL